MGDFLEVTSWNCIYYLMRVNFYGLRSEICPDPLESSALTGTAIYEHGKNIVGVEYADGLVTVTFEDLQTGGSGTVHADLVIAADGTSSKVRQLLQPNLRQKYVGYVAWRGTAPESETSAATRDICQRDEFLRAQRRLRCFVDCKGISDLKTLN
jgi:hypothetical protein